MSITNARRHDLHTGLEEALGPQRAETLMDYLPPVGWADVATKRDLDNVEERVNLRFDTMMSDVRYEIAELRTALMRQQLFISFAVIGVLGTLMAVINGLT